MTLSSIQVQRKSLPCLHISRWAPQQVNGLTINKPPPSQSPPQHMEPGTTSRVNSRNTLFQRTQSWKPPTSCIHHEWGCAPSTNGTKNGPPMLHVQERTMKPRCTP